MRGIRWLLIGMTGMLMAMGCKNEVETSYKEQIQRQRFEKDKTFRYSDESPIKAKKRQFFQSLDYYPIDTAYRIQAEVQKPDTSIVKKMAYSDGSVARFEQFATLTFSFDTGEYQLTGYKKLNPQNSSDTGNASLFFPFKDKTNEATTYKGGRYLDLELPLRDQVILDFNKAYNPYCAYNSKYSCPIPPDRNKLPVSIEAGEKRYEGSQIN